MRKIAAFITAAFAAFVISGAALAACNGTPGANQVCASPSSGAGPINPRALVNGDLPIAGLDKGGTGAALADPDADRIFFWDDSAGAVDFLTVGGGLSLTGTTLTASGGGGSGDVVGPAGATDDNIVTFDGTTGTLIQDSGVAVSDLATAAQGTLADSSLQSGDIGSTIQGYDADLDTWSGVTPSANGQSLVAAANYAAMRTLLDLEAGADFYSISAADAAFQPLDSDLTSVAALTTTAAGRSILTVADPNADRIVAWDDTAGTMAAIALADLTDEPAPASGDFLLAYGAEGDLRKVDWADLPGAGGGISNVVEDTTPQLGGDLDLNGFTITGITAEIDDFVGDSGAGGTSGAVPAPAAGDAAANKFLKADGVWTTPGGSGDVVGPASATAGNIVTFDGATGKLIQDGGAAISALVATADIGSTVQAFDSDLTTWAGLTPSANAQSLVTAANYAAMRALLDLEPGTDFYSISAADAAFQPLDADLTSWAGVTRASGLDTFAATPSSANLQALLTDEVGTGSAYFTGGALGTPASATLTNATGLPVAGITASTSTALGVGSVELGHATDTTIARSSAGNASIEGNLIYRAGGTDVPVGDGGTGLSSGTSGGVPYFSGSTTIASSGELTANRLVLGGGAGASPTVAGSLGTTTTVLHGNAAGAPTFGAVSLTADVSGTLPAGNGGTGNAFTAFTGPATSTKTFTLPNATATILTSNAAVTVAQGGTGLSAGTSGGVPYFSGSTTIASSAALAAGSIVVGGGAGAAPATITLGGDCTLSGSTITCKPTEAIVVAASDETTNLTTGTAKVTWRMPYGFTVSAVRCSLSTAQSAGSIFTVDLNEAGTTILSTKCTIDNSEKTSTTAVTAPVVSDTSLADDAEMTIDIDQVGTAAAKGLKVTIIGKRT